MIWVENEFNDIEKILIMYYSSRNYKVTSRESFRPPAYDLKSQPCRNTVLKRPMIQNTHRGRPCFTSLQSILHIIPNRARNKQCSCRCVPVPTLGSLACSLPSVPVALFSIASLSITNYPSLFCSHKQLKYP